MIDTFKKIKAFAPGNKPFLKTGETGVGKELIAKVIHKTSGRPEPFISVNPRSLFPDSRSAALTETLPGFIYDILN